MYANNEIGTIQNIKRISEICHDYEAFFHCDAAQGFGCKDAILAAINYADAVSVSAHKVYGPKGVGALILKHDWFSRLKPLMFGGSQQQGLRPGTAPLPLIAGFAEAVKLWFLESEKELQKIEALSCLFLQELARQGIDCKLNGPEFPLRHVGNVNVILNGVNNHELLGMLQPKVAASTGSACNSGIPGPSHVLNAIGLSTEQAEASVRFSFGRFSDEEQILEIAKRVSDCVKMLL